MPSDRRGDDPDPDRREGTLAAAGAPRDPGMERTLRQASRFAKARQSASLPELRASMLEHLNAGARPALDELDDADRAQELVYRAWETGNPDRARALLEEALSADPRCVDALVWRAYDEAETPLEVIEALEHAVRAGEEALGAAFFEENRGHFWSIVETRPYMQARMLLAQHLVGTRRPKEGLAHYLELLELCSSDNLGVRYAAAGVALALVIPQTVHGPVAKARFKVVPEDLGPHARRDFLLDEVLVVGGGIKAAGRTLLHKELEVKTVALEAVVAVDGRRTVDKGAGADVKEG